MKKSLTTHLIVLLATIIGGWQLASYLRTQQKEIDPTKTMKKGMSIVSIEKLVSEIQWMLYIYYRGGEKSVNDENKEQLYTRLDTILSRNPNLEIGYTMGAAGLYPRATDEAVKLLKRGCEAPHLQKSWKIPYLVAFYQSMDFFKEIPEDVMRDSLQYFEMAMKRNGGKNHFIASGYYRTKAKLSGEKDLTYALLDVLLKEWRASKNSMDDSTHHSDIQARLLKACKDAVSYEEEPATPRTLKFIERIHKQVLVDEHVCQKCFNQFEPGDKFCNDCGAKVKTYGTCVKCNHVVNGKFCSNCGTQVKK